MDDQKPEQQPNVGMTDPDPTPPAASTPPPSAPADKPKGAYGKRPLWQWVVIYLVIAVIVYFIVYLIWFHKKSASGASTGY